VDRFPRWTFRGWYGIAVILQDFLVKLLRLAGAGLRECSDCDEHFLTYEGLRRHRETVHGDDIIVFRCTGCGKIYQTLPALHGHAERHTGFWSFGNVQDLMEYTEKLKITGYEELDASENHPNPGDSA
jgi:hypothetical protein